MNNKQRLQNIAYLFYKKPWENLTVAEQQDVLVNWEHPFWAKSDKNIESLKKGEKIVIW